MSWQPIETCPKDGTLVLLLFCDAGTAPFPTEDDQYWRTIGFNNFDNVGEDDVWQVCGWNWCHDQFVNAGPGKGDGQQPTHWCPLPELPKAK